MYYVKGIAFIAAMSLCGVIFAQGSKIEGLKDNWRIIKSCQMDVYKDKTLRSYYLYDYDLRQCELAEQALTESARTILDEDEVRKMRSNAMYGAAATTWRNFDNIEGKLGALKYCREECERLASTYDQ